MISSSGSKRPVAWEARRSSAGNLPAEVTRATDGHGVDVVFDPVDGAAYAEAVSVLATDARVLLVGFAGGVQNLDPGSILRQSCSVMGVYVGAHSHDDAGQAYLSEVQAEIFCDASRRAVSVPISTAK